MDPDIVSEEDGVELEEVLDVVYREVVVVSTGRASLRERKAVKSGEWKMKLAWSEVGRWRERGAVIYFEEVGGPWTTTRSGSLSCSDRVPQAVSLDMEPFGTDQGLVGPYVRAQLDT